MVSRALARTAVLLCLTISASLAVSPAGAATTFATGDVFVGVGSNKVQWRLPDGTLSKTLTTGSSSSITTGMAFDDAGKLYVTGYTSNVVNRFATDGTADGTFGSGFNSHPESIVFDKAGNAYVGQERGSRTIDKFNAAGALQATYTTATDPNHGTDRIDLAADQCTVYYTGEAKTIRRFNVCTSSQGSDLTSTLPGKAAEEVRILPGGGVLVADTQAIHRVNAAGSIVQTYDVANRDCWVALALDPTASSFWAADQCASQVYRFAVSSGAVLSNFKTNTKSGSINGLGVSGGATAARSGADLSVTVTGADQTTGNQQYTFSATTSNGGPVATDGVALSFGLDSGTVLSASGSGWSCTNDGQSASCTRSAALAAGSSAPAVNVNVKPPQGTAESQTMKGTASVSGAQPDPNSSNNTSSKQVSVGPYTSGMIPPEGGTVSTATTKCPSADEKQCASVTYPVGPGGFAGVALLGALDVCPSLGSCIGQAVNADPVPAGYINPANPITTTITYFSTLAPGDRTDYSVLVEKLVGGIPVTSVVPDCAPAGQLPSFPCVFSRTRVDGTNDLIVVIKMLSGDPKFQLFGG
jgi:hypothetical protein